MQGNRKQFSRWQTIISRLGSNQKVTAGRLAQELEVSLRTIQRDLDALRDDHGAPIAYDSSRRTLFLEEPTWRLRPVKLTESELFHLVVAAGMAGQFQGTPMAAGLMRLFHKLENVLEEPIDLDPALISEQMSFHGGHPRPFSKNIWIALVKALRSCHMLRLQYRAAGYHRHATLVVEPVHLACRMGDWYLLARREGCADLRVYAISRIQAAKGLHATCPNRAHDSTQIARRTFARFVAHGSTKPVKLRVRFTSQGAEWIRERDWHPAQKISEHRDGSLTLAMPVDGQKEALAWVLRWGAQARVLSPAWLKKRVQAEVSQMSCNG
jgi:predicted DNA-binding transcriptional regulator YafY